MFRGTFAVVNLDAIEANVRGVREWIGAEPRLLIAVKANGYGHGAEAVARRVLEAGANHLGVASVEEGLALRRSGIDAPILVFGAVNPTGTGAIAAAENDIAIAMTDDWSRQHIPAFSRPLKVHLKLDTGMSRLGFTDEAVFETVLPWLRERNDIQLEGVFTHLACADGPDLGHAEGQVERFREMVKRVEHIYQSRIPIVHAANSAATLRRKDWHFNMVRVGISAYGYGPADTYESPIPLQPALNLYSFITRIAVVGTGQSVGYGATFVAKRPTRVATIPVGYADGYPRYLSNRASVIVKGQAVPVIGNVCMDQLMIDVTELPGVKVGDSVTLYGRFAPEAWCAQELDHLSEQEQYAWLANTFRQETDDIRCLSLDILAGFGNTISYEMMCALSARVPRIYSGW